MTGIIIDNEKNVGAYLQKVIEKVTPIKIADVFTNPFEGFFKIGDLKPDIVFLDISMPQVSGIEVAKQIVATYPFCDIVFITAHTEYYGIAKGLHSIGYIMKPVTEEKIELFYQSYQKDLDVLHKQVPQMEDFTSHQGKRMFVTKENEVKVIGIDSIYYLESNRNVMKIVTKEDVYYSRNTLSYYEKTLSKFNFFRCHRSYIVNVNTIESVNKSGLSSYDLKFKDIDETIYVSRDKYKMVLEILKRLNS